MTGSPMSEQLLWCLREAQRTGSVGSGALEDHLEQAAGYFASVRPLGGVCVDLGSGGGLPALPLALAHPTTSWTLVEAWERRAALLRRFVRLLELTGRVSIVHDRAERAARGILRGAADVVTARSFGPAAVTLECAAPMVRVGGQIVLSVREAESPWPIDQLEQLGLGAGADWQAGRFHYRCVESLAPCPEKYPRRPGQAERSPLF